MNKYHDLNDKNMNCSKCMDNAISLRKMYTICARMHILRLYISSSRQLYNYVSYRGGGGGGGDGEGRHSLFIKDVGTCT